jgi:hypothetical protein
MDDDQLRDIVGQIAVNPDLRELLRHNPEEFADRLGLTEADFLALQAANPFINVKGQLYGTQTLHTITITGTPPHTYTLHTITITGVPPGLGTGSIDIRGPREKLLAEIGAGFTKDEWAEIVVRMATSPDYRRRIQRFLSID